MLWTVIIRRLTEERLYLDVEALDAHEAQELARELALTEEHNGTWVHEGATDEIDAIYPADGDDADA